MFASLIVFAAAALGGQVASAGGERALVSENHGVVCIMRGHTGAGAVVMFRPQMGCLGTSCTRPVEQSFDAVVSQTPEQTIAFTSRFVVSLNDGSGPCTHDCGGAGSATSTLTHLPAGTYRLTLGGEEIGFLDTERLKGDPFNRICFGRRSKE